MNLFATRFGGALAIVSTMIAAACNCGCERSQTNQPAQAPVPAASVQTVLPHRGEIARTVALPASRILALQEATLYAKIPGYLKTVAVDKGDQVRKDQVLAELEVPELLAEEAEFKAETEVARVNFERMSEARQKAADLVVPQTVDDLRGRWEVAQAKLRRTQTLLAYTRITAPFDGIVTARFLDPGAFVPAATGGSTPQSAAVLTLMNYTRLRVQVPVPETEVLFVTNGLPVQITAEELRGRKIPAQVTRFAHALDPLTKTMLAEIELDNPKGDLRPGTYAMVQLEVERKKDALLLPVSAVLVEKSGSSVFVPLEGKARKTPVRTGFNDGVNVEVLEGIKPDEPVVVAGKAPLTDGQAIVMAGSK